MVQRRAVITATALGGVISALVDPAAAEPAATPQASASDRATEDVARAVQAVRDELARQYAFGEIAPVRDRVRTFLMANGKFPDYIDVGTDTWYGVYDWHVRFQQPITLNRTADGRYTIALLATTVIMRPELEPRYVGVPYDSR